MSRIAYDPVKDRFAGFIRKSHFLRTLFYNILDLFFLRSWYVRSVLRDIAPELKAHGSWDLLDAGSGFGQYDRFLLKEFPGIRITSIDVKKRYLEDARRYFREETRHGKIEFFEADLLDLDYDTDFDVAICIDVLEHIEDDRRVIGNLQEALRPGGYFLMHSPSVFSEEDAGGEGEESFVDEHARTGYSREDIREKLESAGLEPVKIAYTYGPKGHFAWELIIKYPMIWMTRIKLWALPFMAIWYLFTLPIGLVLMKLDMRRENDWGTGIYALARKPGP